MQTRPAEGSWWRIGGLKQRYPTKNLQPRRRFAIQRLACLLSPQDGRQMRGCGSTHPSGAPAPKLSQLHLLLSATRHHDPVADASLLPTLTSGLALLPLFSPLSTLLYQHLHIHSPSPSHTTFAEQRFSKLALTALAQGSAWQLHVPAARRIPPNLKARDQPAEAGRRPMGTSTARKFRNRGFVSISRLACH